MTEPTPSTPSGPKKLNFNASSAAKPKFLTPALQTKLAEEQAQAAAAAEEQNGLASEEAAVLQDPVLVNEPDVVAEPVLEAVEEITQPEPVAIEEPAPVEPVPQPVVIEEPAPVEPTPQSVAIEEPAPQPVAAEPASSGLDPKVADALAKIREAQEELFKVQQHILSQAIQTSTAPQPTVAVQVPEPTVSEPEPVAAVPQPTPAKPRFNTSAGPALTPAMPGVKKPVQFQTQPQTQVQPQAAQPVTPIQQTVAAVSPSPAIVARPAAAPLQRPVASTASPSSPVIPTAQPPAGQQKTLWQKNKTMIIITGICALLIGSFGWYNYMNRIEQERIKTKNEELGKLGLALKQKANDLGKDGIPNNKYDRSVYGIDVSPNRDDARLLIDAIKKINRESGGWESLMHTLCVMATLDPQIADMLFDDIRKNPLRYGKSKLIMIGVLLSASQDQALMAKLKKLGTDLGKDKQFDKQATLMVETKSGMLPSDLPEVMNYIQNKDTDIKIKTAASTVASYLLMKATPAQHETVAKDILATLKTVDEKDKIRFELLRLLAETGTPQALSYFKGMMLGGDSNQAQLAARQLTNWPTDSLYDEMFELWSNDQTDEKIRQTAFNLMINQLAYDRQRTDEQAMKMFQPLIDAAEKEATPEAKERAKMQIVNALKGHKMHGYVKQLLDMYQKDPNSKIAARARDVAQIINNRENEKNKPKVSREEQKKNIRETMQADIVPA